MDVTMEQMVRLGAPFNPLEGGAAQGALYEGANYTRLKEAMAAHNWQDPRFVSEAQVQTFGWTVREGAQGVETLWRDQGNGQVNPRIVYNAQDVVGMPSLDVMLTVAQDARDIHAEDFGGWEPDVDPIPPGPEAVAVSDELVVAAAQRSAQFNAGERVATAAREFQARQDLDRDDWIPEDIGNGAAMGIEGPGDDEALVLSPAMPDLQAEQTAPQPAAAPALPGAQADRVNADESPELAGRFAVAAPYWLRGIHNSGGLALAERIEAIVVSKGLEEDEEAIKGLLATYPRASALGLAVVPKSHLVNDPLLRTDPARPRTLLDGALVRGGEGDYRPAAGGSPLLRDDGQALVLKRRSEEGYKAVMELAAAKGWTAIELQGKPAMLSNAWVEAQLLGINVTNYQPTPADRERLAERLKDLPARAPGEEVTVQPAKEIDRPVVKTPGVTYAVGNTRDDLVNFGSDLTGAAMAYARAPGDLRPFVIRTDVSAAGRESGSIIATTTMQGWGANASYGKSVGESANCKPFAEAYSQAIKRLQAPGVEAAVKDGTYTGRIAEVSGNAIVQHIGRGKTVTHDAAKLSTVPEVGAVVDIKYRGGVGLVSGQELGRAQGVGR